MGNVIATLQHETSLKMLVKRLFVIEEPDYSRKLKHAEKVLLRANPWLASRSAFKEGRTVLIPGSVGLVLRDRLQTTNEGIPDLLGHVSRQLRSTQVNFAAHFDKARREQEEISRRLEDQELRERLHRAVPQGDTILPSIQDNLHQQADSNLALEDLFSMAGAEAEAALERLLRIAKGAR